MPFAACRRSQRSTASPELVDRDLDHDQATPPTLTLVTTPVRFDAAFVERRMRQHRALQDAAAECAASAIIREVEAGIVAKLNAAYAAVEKLAVRP